MTIMRALQIVTNAHILFMLFHDAGTSPVHPISMVNLEMKLQDNDDQVNSRSDSEDEQ